MIEWLAMNASKCKSAAVLLSQYQSTWKMIRAAIENVPNIHWTYTVGKWYYATTIYHIIETMDFYLRDDPDSMNWGKRAGFRWDDVKDVEKDVLPLISPDLVTSYLSEMEEKFTSFLTNATEDTLLKKDGFHWIENVYQKFLYLLRHNQHHIGELTIVLRKVEADPIKWI
jgi:hypothetical protein